MTGTDIGHDDRIGFDHGTQSFHFTEIADTHFDNCHLMLRTDPEQSKRHTYLVVEVAFCFKSPVAFGKY